MNTQTKQNRAEEQAKAQLESIIEMVRALDYRDDDKRDEAQTAIQEDPLSVEVRTDWHTLDADDTNPTHYRILLCTGGPAVQIVGELSEHLEPETAEIQSQDWGTPWVTYRDTTSEQDAALLTYAQQFYFGES